MSVMRARVGRDETATCSAERALVACHTCKVSPSFYTGGVPRKATVVCPVCWESVERPWLESAGADAAIGEWNRRQAQFGGVTVQHCGSCEKWGRPGETGLERTCLRQGVKFWEMRTYRHMGLQCPAYRAQVGRQGER